MEYGQGGDALVHSRRDARFALSARAERPHRLSMMEGINAGARSKACLFTHRAWLSCGRSPIGKSARVAPRRAGLHYKIDSHMSGRRRASISAPASVLVTGGSGEVGRYLVDELVSHGYTVGVLDLKAPARSDVKHHAVDVLSLEDVLQVMQMGYDAVLHAAGIPHPLDDPPEKVWNVNANGTFNVLQAAAQTQSVAKVIFTSSVSTLGFAFAKQRLAPLHIPIDESHPNRPQDVYGLSKVACEQILKTYSEQHGINTVCLRMPWVWLPEDGKDARTYYRSLIAETLAAVAEPSPSSESWHRELWAYVDARDVGQASRLALEVELPSGHEAFFITGPHNWTRTHDGRALIAQFWPEVTDIDPAFDGMRDSLISHGKAARMLGYAPKYGVAHVLDEQSPGPEE